MADQVVAGRVGEVLAFEELLPSPEAGPEAIYARRILVEELADSGLASEQRKVRIPVR